MLKIRQIGWEISKKCVIHWKILFRTKSEWLSLKILLMVPKNNWASPAQLPTHFAPLVVCKIYWSFEKIVSNPWLCNNFAPPLVCKNVCPSRHLPTVYENCLYLPPARSKIVCHPLCVEMFVGPPHLMCVRNICSSWLKKMLFFPKFLVFKLVKISQGKFYQEKWYRDICLQENFVLLTNV